MIATLVEPLVDLVLPRRCAGCDRPGSGWCASCRGCIALRSTLLAGLPVLAATDYAGPARRAVLVYKERGRRDLARPLGRILAVAVQALLATIGLSPRTALLVCVPSTRASAARRGGDHVARLAHRAAPVCGVAVARGLLRVSGDVLDSAGLGASDRSANLSGAMHAVREAAGPRRDMQPRRLIVVDDIVSSGSTMREATRALAAAGWPVAGAVALAATPPTGSGAAVRWQPHSDGNSRRAHWHRPGDGSSVGST